MPSRESSRSAVLVLLVLADLLIKGVARTSPARQFNWLCFEPCPWLGGVHCSQSLEHYERYRQKRSFELCFELASRPATLGQVHVFSSKSVSKYIYRACADNSLTTDLKIPVVDLVSIRTYFVMSLFVDCQPHGYVGFVMEQAISTCSIYNG